MVFRGFRFGMVLQLAVGPICLLVFSTAAEQGFLMALPLVCAVTLVDALFIFLSGVGVSAVLSQPKIKKAVKLLGACVLLLFGADMILGAFDLSLLPQIQLFRRTATSSVFWQGILMTAANPLTILFWSGVFSSQIAEHGYTKREITLFGVGCVLSTVIALSAVAAVGVFAGSFLSEAVRKALNICAGLFVVYFACKLAFKKV